MQPERRCPAWNAHCCRALLFAPTFFPCQVGKFFPAMFEAAKAKLGPVDGIIGSKLAWVSKTAKNPSEQQRCNGMVLQKIGSEEQQCQMIDFVLK